ncbi:alpha/beta fold hydrolase [Sphingomonas sp. MMS24-JH45]
MRLQHDRPLVDDVYRVPILLVMATTNRGFIFDMVPGQSMVEYLLRAGFDVFMLEWEPPRPHERALTLENCAIDFVSAAVEQVAEEKGEPDVSVVGYCFGGVLSLLWAALEGEGRLANLATFTTPVDFRHMDLFQAWSDRRFFDVDRLVDTLGNVPGEMLYGAFYMLRPAAQTAQNVRLYDNLWDDAYVKSVRMFERWNNDTLPLAGNISARRPRR